MKNLLILLSIVIVSFCTAQSQFRVGGGFNLTTVKKSQGYGLEAELAYNLSKKFDLGLDYLYSTYNSENSNINKIGLYTELLSNKEKKSGANGIVGVSLLNVKQEEFSKNYFGFDVGGRYFFANSEKGNFSIKMIYSFTFQKEFQGQFQFGLIYRLFL